MDKNFLVNNREKLAGKIDDGSVMVLFAGVAPHRSADNNYAFSVNRNFLYMVGTAVEGQKLIMTKRDGKVIYTLYIADVNEHFQKWIGRQMTIEQAKALSGIDNVKYLSTYEADLYNALYSYSTKNIYLDLDRNSLGELPTIEERFADEMSTKFRGLVIKNIYSEICILRFVKTDEEIAKMQKAINITETGIMDMMATSKVGKREYEYEAVFDYALTRAGVRENAFETILAAGDNACILHYVEKLDTVEDNELLLCDLGASWEFYCADITRTFPVNGKFTPRQKVLYNIVLEGGKKVMEAAKPGVTTGELNKVLVDFFAQELLNIGLIKEASEVSKYYFHGVSHPLGLDTHDVGDRTMKLVPGTVITVEPGLYIAEEALGIRIEDDILITETGNINLSEHIIKEIADIEAFMNK